MSFRIVFSNRVEILEDLLTDELAGFSGDPFAAQQVVVPSRAVARRLQLAVARKNGVCANIEFNFLGAWLWRLARVVDPDVPERSPFDPERMAWRILRLLDGGKAASHPRLAAFLRDADDLMRWELSQSVARVFDHYATYRPDWLAAWSRGKRIADFEGDVAAEADEGWQGELWRAVRRELGLGTVHPLQQLPGKLSARGRSGIAPGLPARTAIFAVPVIPPLYLETIRGLAGFMEITLYIVNPCREYWFEIVPPKRLAYLRGIKREAHQEVGHALLADWGRAAQSAIDLIYGEAAETLESTLFEEPAGETLLARLQRSVFSMEDLAPGSAGISAEDRSVEIHCCHGAVRELEALHDRLLERFAADPTLRADEVLVLTPDIDALASSVEAVFGTVPPSHFIPYAVAGRAMALTNPFLQALLELLDLLASRMPAGRVFDLLRQDVVARRFGLDEEELKRVRGWLGKAGIRWGLDGEHRGEMGLPPEERHTFRCGLDSLFLGLALPCPDGPLAGLLPGDSLEGSRAETLGKMWRFVERLSFWRGRLRNPRPAGEWQEILHDLLADFTVCESDAYREYDQIAGAVAELAEDWRAANLALPVSSGVVRAALSGADERRRGAVPSGAVTFASLSAMRGIPCRLLCLIGMNDEVHPLRERPLEFDLIPRGKPRRGDRQRRLEERGIFLDALLAAREAIHISYSGRDQRDNAAIPPSVLVAELLDYLVQAAAPENPTAGQLKAIRERLTVVHPLQPFSRRYFDGSDPRLFSHVRPYAAAVRALEARGEKDLSGIADAMDDEAEEEQPEEPFRPFFNGMPEAAAAAAEEPPSVGIEDLLFFLRNPSRFFLQRRLLIHLPREEDAVADEEPLLMDFLEKRSAAGIVVEASLAQRRVLGAEEALALLRAAPGLPPGTACEAGLSLLWPTLAPFAERLLEATDGPELPPCDFLLSVDLREETWRLKGLPGELRADGLIRHRCDELRPVDRLEAWIRHLFLCAARPEGVNPRTRHLAFDQDLCFEEIPAEEAGGHLADLIGLYREGLERPVPFFRKASWAYAEKGKLHEARSRWAGGYGAKGEAESTDIWHSLAWRGAADPLGGEFAEIAQRVYGPILRHGVVLPQQP